MTSQPAYKASPKKRVDKASTKRSTETLKVVNPNGNVMLISDVMSKKAVDINNMEAITNDSLDFSRFQ